MTSSSLEEQLRAENAQLRTRLEEAEATNGAATDITARKLAETKLAEVTQRCEMALKSAQVTLFHQDLDLRYTWIYNPVLGYDSGQVIGKRDVELFERAGDAVNTEAMKREVIHTGTSERRDVLIHAKGVEHYYDLLVEPLLNEAGSIAGVTCAAIEVTGRKQAEDALRENRQFTSRVLNNVLAFVGVMTPDGTLIDANRAALEAAGISPSEVIGKKFWDCYWWNYAPELQAQLRAACERAAMGEVVRYDVPVRMAGEAMVWIDFQLAPLCDGEGRVTHLIPSGMDITERRRSAESLRQNAELFVHLVDQAPSGVYVVDADFRVQQVNALAAPVFAKVDGLIGRDFTEVNEVLWGPKVAAEVAHIFRHTLDTGEGYVSPSFTHERQDIDVEEAYEWQIKRVSLADGRHGVVCYFEDVTESRRAKEKLRSAMEAAETANAAKDRFIAMLSHELRTPLTPVLMVVGLLEQEPGLSAQMREDLAMIKRNIVLETKLIDDLLDLSRIHSGKLLLAIAPVDLNEAVRHVCCICQSDLQGGDIHLAFSLDPTAGPVAADHARLQQILWNVLRNAIKFTPKYGDIRIMTTRLAAGRCEVRVQDSGVGIPQEMLPRIFDAFEQGGTSVTRQFGGLGLGLAICKALVELHQGTIRVESPGEGKGATFIIELPVAPSVLPATDTLAQTARAQVSRPIRLLLVEDHADTVRMLTRLLTNAGFVVVSASDVASALAAAERETFDVLISDLGLPDGSGNDVMRALRLRSDLPGIVMSGYGREEDVRWSEEAGFSEHLVKPVDPVKLKEAIFRVTQNRG